MKNNAILLFFVLFVARFSLILAESVEDEQGDPYYGVPLGALHYSAEGTSAEVYAADEFSIIFNHFYHNPREQGCTAMMIGPPRMEDKDNVVPGHGILLTMAHPPTAARHKQKRAKRATASPRTANGRSGGGAQTERQRQQFLGNWPAEFDHLLMEPMPEMKTDQKQQQRKKEEDMAVMNRVNLSNTSVTDQLIQSARLILDNNALPSQNGTVPPLAFSSSAPSTVFASVPTISAPNSSSTSAMAPSSSSSSPQHFTTFTSSQKPTPSTTAKPTTAASSSSSQSPPIILLSNKKAKEGHPPQKQSSPPPPSNLVEKAQTLAKDMMTHFEGDDKVGSGIRRAPARQSIDTRLDDWMKANELDEKGIPPTLRTAPPKLTMTTAATTTPLFWVIKDPREARRERLLQLRRKLDPNPEPPTTTTTAAPLMPLQTQFELRRIRDKLVTFSLTNGAKITQYKWIGLWNQCTKRHIPLVSLRDVDPPREEKIMPLSGWSHNVTSYRLHILNCNTILIPSFHYDSRNTTRNTYFFVGVGQFPEAVEQQLKANVVGTRPGEPLRSYKGEDLMLRLPRPYRTFDIDFISIFNMDEQKSFGHVIIPSLLVPPCPYEE